jgi:TIR domain
MAEKPPDAFLSYTRFDDRNDGGAITQFRARLENSVRAVTGKPFDIFQDVDDIAVGERWSDKLDEMLDEVRFFIPILTPSYFQSQACRGEIEKFLKAEERAGRKDLILPIYYIQSPSLEDEGLRRADRLASTIDGRQRWDWRDLRYRSLRSLKV